MVENFDPVLRMMQTMWPSKANTIAGEKYNLMDNTRHCFPLKTAQFPLFSTDIHLLHWFEALPNYVNIKRNQRISYALQLTFNVIACSNK